MTDFLVGKLANLSTGITWKGKFGNETYQQLQQKLYKNNYTGLMNDTSKFEDIFLVAQGYCKKLIQSNSAKYEIWTTGKNYLKIVDPRRISRLTIKEMDNSRIDFGSTDEDLGHYTEDVYGIQCTLHNHDIHDGTKCLNYENSNSSYEDCVESKLKDIILVSYGCLPPWFPKQEYALQNNFETYSEAFVTKVIFLN
jgi:hypothetical protein